MRARAAQMLRELLTESRDFGTLLGAGGGPGGPRGGALHAYVPNAAERRQLFEAVAYECQVGAGRAHCRPYLAHHHPISMPHHVI